MEATMTFEELHAAHVRLWDWLAENPGKYKHDAPERLLDGAGWQICFACVQAKVDTEHCKRCPVDWGVSYCDTPGSPFDKWDRLMRCPENFELRAELARIIRDLPWTEK
jgi:hypothetical protein